MGFIDWHKNKKDHYEDVLDYAKARREEEARQQRDKQIRCWMGELLADPRYANVKSSDTIKLLVREYLSLKKEYDAFVTSCPRIEKGIDKNLLWEDLWTATAEQILAIPNLSEKQELTLLYTLQEKVFKLHTCLSAEQHKHERQTNRKYKRYLDNCFTVGADFPMLFWRYMNHIRRHSGQAVAKMIEEAHPEFSSRVTILGHLQRGGSPSASDRILASRMGIAAVQALLEDQRNIMVGVKNGEIDYVPLTKAIKEKKDIKDDKWNALQVLSI